MNISNDNLNFKAKFLKTDSLYNVAEYAKNHGKFDKLNAARKNIDCSYLDRRLKFELFTTVDGFPCVIITRFKPKEGIINPQTTGDYVMSEPYVFNCYKKINPLKFGYNTIIKLSNSAPNNKMYKKVVAGRG